MKKIFSAALALVCVWFATPAFANCNLFDGQIEKGSIDLNNGSVLVDNENRTRSKNFIAVQPNTQYVFTREDTNGIRWIVGYDKDKNPVTDSAFDRPHPSAIKNLADGGTNSTTFTTTPTTYYIRWYNTSNSGLSEKVQIEKGTTATEYTPYNPLCATCDGTVVNYVSATGTVSQSGTPTPDNPIEPTFYTQGDMVLRAVGDYADSYDATTGKITRRVGVKVLDGTEDWNASTAYNGSFFITGAMTSWGAVSGENNPCTHFSRTVFNDSNKHFYVVSSAFNDVTAFKSWLAEQYAAGTPVTIYYPLATAVEEDWPASYCEIPIKIATTKYNETAFGPLNTALQNAISVVDTVVSNTITQAGRIATLQTQKQTRPNDIADDNEKCPAGKKCLLVEDASGVPHWYEIVEQYSRLPEGFTELQYVSNAANTYLDTGIIPTVDNVVMEMKVKPSTGSWYIWQNRDPSDNVIHGFSGANTGSKIGFAFPNASIVTSTITRTGNILTMRSTMLNGQGKLYVHDDVTNESDEQTIAYTFSAETLPYYLFGNQRSDTVNSGNAVYYAKMYMNDELVMDYIPAKRNRDGAIGFYDLASQSFKQANHGSFVAGPVAQ